MLEGIELGDMEKILSALGELLINRKIQSGSRVRE